MGNKQIKGKFSYLKNVILLDTVSTIKENIMNPNLVTDIRNIRNPVGMRNDLGKK